MKQHFQNPELSPCNVAELAELSSTEISLDLQGLIDDSHFGDDNLFSDLIDGGKKSDGSYRTSPTHSLGSSGQSSPGGGQESPPNFQYRNISYMPGSVHGGATFGNHMQQQQQQPIVKQEPLENEFRNHFGGRGNTRGGAGLLAPANSIIPNNSNSGSNGNNQQNLLTNNSSSQQYSNSTVSSTTNAMAAFVMNGSMNGGAGNGVVAGTGSVTSNQPLPSLKSFAVPPRYLQPHTTNGVSTGSKKRMDRNSDEYRKRRERNNVAVRKSREKAKMRSRETEERVKILARENERLQKKVELLQEELSVLRSLFSNVGVLPDHIHRELAKHMDNFQQQHNAMSCM